MAAAGLMRRITSVTVSEPLRGVLLVAQNLVQVSGLMTSLLLLLLLLLCEPAEGVLTVVLAEDSEAEDGCADTLVVWPPASLTHTCNHGADN